MLSKKLSLTVAILLGATLLVSGCTVSGSGTSNTDGPVTITEAGSSTVQPLAEKMALKFMDKHPSITVVIQGGGSSVGITSAADGTIDIGASSRELKPGEPELLQYVLARDGIAIIVHPDNPVSSLSKIQIQDIFSGVINDWAMVGGKAGAIHLAVREEGSGTRTAFEEMVVGKDRRILASAILQSSNGAIHQVVAGDERAIGFVSFGYIDGAVKAVAVDGVSPTVANAKNKTYSLVRPLLFLTRDPPQGALKDFLDFCTGLEGQAIVSEEGYISA